MLAFQWTQSTTIRVPLKAFLASDHVSPATGKTIAVVISKDGAAFGNPSGGATNATEIGNGWYYVDLSTTDTNTLGPIAVRGTEGTIDPTETAFMIVAAGSSAPTAAAVATAVWTDLLAGADFSTVASIGKLLKDSIDAAISSRMATFVLPTNFSSLSIDAAGRVKALVGLTQNVAFADFQFRMVDSDGLPVTGLVNADFTTKTFTIAGGAQGSIAGTITEDPGADGFYLVDLLAAELNGRSISLVFEATGTLQTAMTIWPSQ